MARSHPPSAKARIECRDDHLRKRQTCIINGFVHGKRASRYGATPGQVQPVFNEKVQKKVRAIKTTRGHLAREREREA
eukprot:6208747-Pleurochrysis_carterae.AAC.1